VPYVALMGDSSKKGLSHYPHIPVKGTPMSEPEPNRSGIPNCDAPGYRTPNIEPVPHSVSDAGRTLEDNRDADAVWGEVQAGLGGMARTAGEVIIAATSHGAADHG
jgi:hypothetical protein